ncbi:S-adenosylhomocysteine deaminase [Candidatus Vecturithrix granuli]|uniref:S-adenosylhomocysteine deaminase n=1 Tax=Vecturithrix granuli TaxID=1499967 RepID=A0A081BUJ3_VECG1|nr:S-adenosylhomocysteine deaminase [Candidatus Vecturithrix granuli]
MSKILLKHVKEIVTMDAARTRFQGYSLLIDEHKIAKIAKDIEVDVDEVIDGTDYFLYPGLINTHHHFYQALTRNIRAVQEAELFDWLKFLYPLWARLTHEAVYYSSLVAMGELLKTGCTTSTDQFYVFPKGQTENLIDEEFRAAAEIGIRFHGCRGSMSRSVKDGGLPPDSVVQAVDEILADSQRVIETYHDNRPFAMQRVALAPCSPFSITEDLLRKSIKLARSYKVMSHTHLAETLDEERYCQEKLGLRPLEYMESVGWIGDDVWYAHGIHFTDDELDRLADTGTGVAHCPTSNMEIASGIAKVPQMWEKGVQVGLAVDGCANNDASNMLLELKIAYLLHRQFHGVHSMSVEKVLALATNGGRDILNQPEIGSLEEGKAADMFLVNTRRLDFAGGVYDPVSALVRTGNTQVVDLTIVNGKIVVRDGQLVTIDEALVAEKTNEISRQMVLSQ